MSSDGGSAPTPPDPEKIIGLENKYNRYNTNNPFGSATWSDDGSGHETLTQSPNDQMQGAIDRAFKLSATPSQKEYIPQGMDQLASAIMGRVGKRYGLGDGSAGGGAALNTNLKPQGQQPMPPPQAPQGGAGMSGMNFNTMPAPPVQQRMI